MEKMKKVKKKGKCQTIQPSPAGIEPQILEQNFPAKVLNFEGD